MSIDSFEQDLICGRCGSPIRGYAYASRQNVRVFYCHPENPELYPDCYNLSMRAGFPELPDKPAPLSISTPGVYELAYLRAQVRQSYGYRSLNPYAQKLLDEHYNS